MASSHCTNPISKSPSIKILKHYNTEEIQDWFKTLKIQENIIPTGWKSAKQLREMFGIPKTTLESYLKKSLKSGFIEKRYFKFKNKINAVVPFYHQIKKGAFNIEKN